MIDNETFEMFSGYPYERIVVRRGDLALGADIRVAATEEERQAAIAGLNNALDLSEAVRESGGCPRLGPHPGFCEVTHNGKAWKFTTAEHVTRAPPVQQPTPTDEVALTEAIARAIGAHIFAVDVTRDDKRIASVKFCTTATISLATLQALATALGTDAINFNFGEEGEAGYSSHTPGTDGSMGWIEALFPETK